ncbi:Rpn family recombination-promoting nuclease/putative transposase [Desulfococcaceae bacterium HSG9]|nr:Rpn family recombination-promoting nuclease/putative transposase [Desulfococcaceae bacterium HSG9]
MFFKETFSRKEVASGFLHEYLPEDILRKTDLDSLAVVKDSFVDKEEKIKKNVTFCLLQSVIHIKTFRIIIETI